MASRGGMKIAEEWIYHTLTMNSLKPGHLLLFPLATMALLSCSGPQFNPEAAEDASSTVQPSVTEKPTGAAKQDTAMADTTKALTTKADTALKSGKDTAAKPIKVGKP